MWQTRSATRLYDSKSLFSLATIELAVMCVMIAVNAACRLQIDDAVHRIDDGSPIRPIQHNNAMLKR